ncbi:MAG TPA: OstA-like protein [Chitinophagaceae bacterium]|nr:OstA-like protein [Chitinophagaceae bacterium]
MNAQQFRRLTTYLAFIICSLACTHKGLAQVITLDSNNLKLIQIHHADSLVIVKDDDKNFNKLFGAVNLEHDGVVMNCDSAYFFLEQNYVEAFSNVRINKANGSSAVADYMKYTGNNNSAFLKDNVQIIDGGNQLITNELIYNIKTKIGKYTHGGSVQTDGTNVSSETGTYNGYSQQTYFKKDVVVNNEKYSIQSKELTYNIKTKVVKLLDESTIVTENSTIQTRKGQYDSKTGNAVFDSRTTIENEDQVIIGNRITYNDKQGYAKATGNVFVYDTKNDSKLAADIAEYNKLSGFGKASGNVILEQQGGKTTLTSKEVEFNKKTGYAKANQDVIVIDTAEKSKLLCGTLEFNDNSGFMLATKNPKLITLADQDSMFMRMDTLISIRNDLMHELTRKQILPNDKKNTSPRWMYSLLLADSTYKNEEDTVHKNLIANHNVKLYSDSMQVVCDSLFYLQSDSIFKLYKSPVMWSKSQQSSADTILLKTVSNKLSEVNLIQSSLLLSETGYEGFYNQLSGNYIDAYFIENQIDKVYVNQNAESIYFEKDDEGACIGANKVASAKINAYFKDKELDHIVLLEQPAGDFTPSDELTEATKFLTTFKLFDARKPLSKDDILTDTLASH